MTHKQLTALIAEMTRMSQELQDMSEYQMSINDKIAVMVAPQAFEDWAEVVHVWANKLIQLVPDTDVELPK